MKTVLVVGLGNPEGKYFNTYHNAGFLAVDLLAQRMGLTFKKKGNQMLADFLVSRKIPSISQMQILNESAKTQRVKVFLLKPLTYMNLSGQAVVALMRKQKIDPANLFVLVDDIYTDKGKIRIRHGGTHAGQNGIRSINDLVGTNAYTKIKIGIKPEREPHSMSDYVLKKIDEQSKPLINQSLEMAVDAVEMLLNGEPLNIVQGKYNTKNEVGV